MAKEKIDLSKIGRFNVNPNKGLTSAEVEVRKKQKLTNKQKVKVGKSYLEIIFTDLFSFFNILLFAIAALMIYAEHYDGLFFLAVLIPNIGITLYEDIHARRLLGKLNMINQPKVNAIRNDIEVEIKSDEIVLDDILHIQGSSQITVDSIVLTGELLMNESLLTGESIPVKKTRGDTIYAGSFSISGDADVRVDKIGKYCYIETIHEKANKFKRTPSEIKHSLDLLFKGIGVIVIAVAILMGIIYWVQGRFGTVESIKYAISNSISGSMVAMIPSGMYLLTSAAFSLSVINLSQKNAQIQDFYSVEMLSKINVLCVDKTGTITDGKLQVKRIIPLNSSFSEITIGPILNSLVAATKDNNQTAKCILEKYGNEKIIPEKAHISFNSINKYSAVTLVTGETYVLGAYEFISITNRASIESNLKTFAELGLRTLVLCRNYTAIKEDKIQGKFEAVAIVILEDHIKKDAKETFAWFNENGVEVKVISGDNARAVSYIAKEAGILNTEKFISLEGMPLEQVKEIADKYTVFGRVGPEQKEALISAIKDSGKKVAMTGDGVNDILALKRADCSIAMANGSDAARNVSNIVLLDSNFHSLPNVVSEGRRIVNNLQRTCSLFLAKTMFAIFFSLTFLLTSYFRKDPSIHYPFLTNHLYLWEIFGIGLSAFFISLEKNENKYEGNFLANVMRKAIPAGIIMIISTALVYLINFAQEQGFMNFGIIDGDTVVAMAAITFSVLSLVVLYDVCSPLNFYRGLVLLSSCLLVGGIGTVAYFITMRDGNPDKSLIRIPFEKMTAVSWFVTGIIIVFCAMLYLFVSYVIKVVKDKGEIQNAKNK